MTERIGHSVQIHTERMKDFAGARIFYRCLDCCLVIATEGQKEWGVLCVCGSQDFEMMGRVTAQNRLVSDKVRSVCDDRCTNAQGPNCDCQCGGQNHGSRLVVRIIRDVGAVPHIELPDATGVVAATARAVEFRAARDAAHARIKALGYDEIATRKSRGGYLQPADFDKYLVWTRAHAEVRKAGQAKRHATRMKKLGAILTMVLR